jgi:hypothetical protein
VRKVDRSLLQVLDRDIIDQTTLSDVTVGETREGRGQVVVDEYIATEPKNLHRGVHVTQLGSPPDQTGPLGGDETNTYLNVVTVMFVLEGQSGDFSMRNGEHEAFAGGLSPQAATGRHGCSALQTRLPGSRELGGGGGHRGTHGARDGDWRKRGLGHPSTLPPVRDQTRVSQLSY